MVYDGYLDLAGVEIINTARLAAYAAQAGLEIGCDTCPQLPAALGDLPYFDLTQDAAPWWDPATPESAKFLGVMGLGVAGLSASTITRSPVPLVGDGSAIGPVRREHREIGYTVGLLARGEAALSYGIEWLSAALQGGACDGCSGSEMCVFASCPGELAEGDPCSGAAAPAPPAGELGDRELRHLFDVALLEGPQVTETAHLSKGLVWATVTFTLIAGKPWVHRSPLPSLRDWVPLGTQPLVGPLDPDQTYEDCPVFEPCLEDPTCPAPAMPPRPPAPRDPCYPTGPDTFRRALIELDPAAAPDWSELVPVVEVSAGNGELRRLIVRFWTNPYRQPCANLSDPCTACFDVQLPYLPPGALLTVDGRVQRASVGCPQGDEGYVTATPSLIGAGGAAFEWPTFPCPSGICVEVLSLGSVTARNAQVRVRLVPRSDAI